MVACCRNPSSSEGLQAMVKESDLSRLKLVQLDLCSQVRLILKLMRLILWCRQAACVRLLHNRPFFMQLVLCRSQWMQQRAEFKMSVAVWICSSTLLVGLGLYFSVEVSQHHAFIRHLLTFTSYVIPILLCLCRHSPRFCAPESAGAQTRRRGP